jgi:hypothetical protein
VRHSEKLAPVAAVVGAISSVACLLPASIAAGAAGIGPSAFLMRFRPYLIAASLALLLFGLWQLYRRRGASSIRSRVSIVFFWICAVVVAIMMMIPQIIADFLADL